MENIANFEQEFKLSWFDKRCRQLVFSVFERLEDTLEVVENGQITKFGLCQPSHQQERLHGQIIIHDAKIYRDFIQGGSIGVAEGYIDKRWSSPDLTKVIRIFAKAQNLTDKIEAKSSWLNKVKHSLFHYVNRNSHKGAKKNILAHYDLGNELYKRFLDPEMVYSAAIYPSKSSSLAQAQLHKLELICQRLNLKASEHLLEIGTGWGALAIYAAQHYGCKVTTTTISEEQYQYAKARIEQLGLTQQITLLKEDYRNLTGQFDKLVSIEMIEAVGYQYMNSFFNQCNARLRPGGKMLLQAITIADQRFEYYRNNVDFIQRYIFPGGFLPSINLMTDKLNQQTDMVMEELHDIGLDYARTLADWRNLFNQAWPELKTLGFDEQFKRLWLYYFAYCEGAFLERSISTVHLIARK
jgi:cyclopropane-fatty-acyl-phospholipid synthase